jgi:carbon starvation protein
MKRVWFNSALAVALMFIMCYFNAFEKIWPMFGSGNQLLAALVLLVISLWLLGRGRQAWFAILPAVFMTITTMGALVYLLVTEYLPKRNMPLLITDIFLIALALVMAVMAIRAFVTRQYTKPQPEPAAGA